MKKKSVRRIAREKSLQVLYAYEMNNEGLESLFQGVFSEVTNAPAKDFARELVDKVIIHKTDFDEEILKFVSNWEIDRIALIDKLLIKMALAEMLFFSDIPPKVSINEALEISKEFSTPNSAKFINGILDKIYLGYKQTDKIKKIGRGLIENKTKDTTNE